MSPRGLNAAGPTDHTRTTTGSAAVVDVPASFESGTVRTNDVETYYVRGGDGPAIVFVHGAIVDHRMWGPQLAALHDAYTVVAYDVRGHGRTGGSTRESYTVADYVADLDALLAALDVERAVLCGLSLGGCIAQAYAATHPEQVAGLVLADTFTTAPLGPTGRLLFANLRLFAALDRVVGYRRLNRLQLRVGQRLKPGVAGDGATIQRLIDEGPTIPHAEFRKIVGSIVAFPRSDFDPAHIEATTTVLYGANEPSLIREHATFLRDRISGVVLVVELADAGHASNLDRPAAFTDAVRDLAEEAFGSD